MNLFNPDLDTPTRRGRASGMTLYERFISKLGRQDANGCLLWAGHTDGNGRGKIFSQYKALVAPRVAYLIAHGPFDDSLVVRHTCDNPLCVEPSHLELGTHADNMRDKYDRDRANHARGEAHGFAKLTEAQVLEIYRRAWDGESQQDLGTEFGVNPGTISKIKHGKKWAWLTGHISRSES